MEAIDVIRLAIMDDERSILPQAVLDALEKAGWTVTQLPSRRTISSGQDELEQYRRLGWNDCLVVCKNNAANYN